MSLNHTYMLPDSALVELHLLPPEVGPVLLLAVQALGQLVLALHVKPGIDFNVRYSSFPSRHWPSLSSHSMSNLA